MPEKLDNARLEQITEQVSTDVRTLIAESEKEILTDYHTVVEEAQDDEKEKMPPLKLSFVVTFDPEHGPRAGGRSDAAETGIELNLPAPVPDQPAGRP